MTIRSFKEQQKFERQCRINWLLSVIGQNLNLTASAESVGMSKHALRVMLTRYGFDVRKKGRKAPPKKKRQVKPRPDEVSAKLVSGLASKGLTCNEIAGMTGLKVSRIQALQERAMQ